MVCGERISRNDRPVLITTTTKRTTHTHNPNDKIRLKDMIIWLASYREYERWRKNC